MYICQVLIIGHQFIAEMEVKVSNKIKMGLQWSPTARKSINSIINSLICLEHSLESKFFHFNSERCHV